MGEPSEKYKQEQFMIELEDAQRRENIERKRDEHLREQRRQQEEFDRKRLQEELDEQARQAEVERRKQRDFDELRAKEAAEIARKKELDIQRKVGEDLEEQQRQREIEEEERSQIRNREIRQKMDQRKEAFGAGSNKGEVLNVSDMKVGHDDPLVRNEGDEDLEPYLKKTMSSAGGSIKSLEVETLKRAYSDGTLQVVGVNLWTALHSVDQWKHREAAVSALISFLQAPLPKKYDKNTSVLFMAVADIAMIAMRDQVIKIYFGGIHLLDLLMEPNVCSGDIIRQTVNQTVRPFIKLLFDKVCDMNFKQKEAAENALLRLFR